MLKMASFLTGFWWLSGSIRVPETRYRWSFYTASCAIFVGRFICHAQRQYQKGIWHPRQYMSSPSFIPQSHIQSHISSRPKIVLTGDLGPDSMALLQQTQVEIEASRTAIKKQFDGSLSLGCCLERGYCL